MLFNLIYDILLIALSLIAIPKMLYQWVFHKKYLQSIPQRLGVGFPEIQKGDNRLIWIHAVSVGETKAVAAIVKRIREDNRTAVIVVSSVTETGHAEAKRSIPEANYHVFLPLDLMWIVKPIIKKIRPNEVILCETDFWYNFLKCCKNEGAVIHLVNGKLSQKSLKRFQKFSLFSTRLFSLIDLFCVQSSHFKDRFLELGVPQEKIKVTGNIKFDGNYPTLTQEALQLWKKKLGIPEDNLVLVAGSTHHPEERLILDALHKVWQNVPDVSVVIVPRHPERFDEVAALLEKSGLPFNRYSQIENNSKECKVVLIDAMGLLRQCYQLAHVAFVAGSFTAKVGGHNIIEPSWYGVPVIYGPYMHSQPELVELMENYRAGIAVKEEELSQVLLQLFGSKLEREKLGLAGRKMVDDLRGAAEKTCKTLKGCEPRP